MNQALTRYPGRVPFLVMLLLAGSVGQLQVRANPTAAGTTVTQGAATFSGSGSQFNINQTSANAFISWQSFNINAGETTTFIQPSSTSVTWNYINDPNASSINGNLNANGYVVLQNPNGFTVGGQAAISAHGLIMTTASTPNLNLSSGGAWAFNAPPPTAQIVNYGHINISGGGSAYLIASDIVNNGTISAPNGKIGLYAGQQVLVSMSPDGRGLSAQVTLPQGSVDNNGNLIADGGSIAAQAQTVNQGGLVQANSAQNVNGTIELVASETLNLRASSTLSAEGNSQAAGTGGITLQAGNIINNDGQAVADGSSILLKAPTVNQNGILQANSLGNINGAVEIDANASLNLGAGSQILANGDSTAAGASPGGFVVLHADNSFADTASSTISVSGAAGGQNGIVEIFDPGVGTSPILSSIGSCYALLINPNNLTLSTGATSTSPSNPNLNLSALLNYSQVYLYNIELASLWNLGDASVPATLNWSAMNNIIMDNSSGIVAGNNWNINLTAGTSLLGTTVSSGSDGIYLSGGSFLQTRNGDIDLWAANEVIVNSGAIRTIGGGNIGVTAEFGDVNSGTSAFGYNYFALGTGTATAPYYTPFQLVGSGSSQHINFDQSNLGGISTAAGGNVTINAGNDVISFPTTTVAAGDPGTGAFGPQAGNVTITAGGSVLGHYVLANGTGTITAGNDIGVPGGGNSFALSLVRGTWNVNALEGNIYLQEVRNPNGVFNNTQISTLNHNPSAGNHFFDYDPQASVSLTADGVYLTGFDLPRPNGAVPLLLPPTLIIYAGAGGVTLQNPIAIFDNINANDFVQLSDFDITLFPSVYGNLQINTTGGGGLTSENDSGAPTTLLMSDSGQTHWFISPTAIQPFSENDHASVPAELNNNNPVVVNISGNMENVVLQTDKATRINVGGDMIGCTFFGENLHPGDVTSITVGGQIFNAGSFNSVTLAQGFPVLALADLRPGEAGFWYSILELAVDPSRLPTQSLLGVQPSQLASYLASAVLFPGISIGGNLTYDSSTRTLTAIGPLSSDLLTALTQPTLTVVRYGPNGYPLVDTNPHDANYGHFVTDTLTWVPGGSLNASLISSLYTASQGAPPLGANNGAYVVGGTGVFDVTANSISLGNSDGILSVGNGHVLGRDYSFLAPYITSGPTINVTADYLEMPTSTIATLGGGDLNVICTGVIPGSVQNRRGVGVSMDLGSQDLLPFEASIMNDNGQIALGVYTSGGGNVNVTAQGTINIDSSRIATFDGGNIVIQSLTGDVNAGSGSTISIPIQSFSPYFIFPSEPMEFAFANGIVADTLLPRADGSLVPGAAALPGNITVLTPQGDIFASLGGILQEKLGGTLLPGPFIDLEAGTPANGDWNSTAPPVYIGNIDLGDSGAIGGTVNVKATGRVKGLLISSLDANVTAGSIGSLIVVATHQANVRGPSDGEPITIIAPIVATSGVGPDVLVFSQNYQADGNAGQSTLGSSASATSTSQSAAGETSDEAQQQVAGNGDDDEKKKKKKPEIRKVGRVTVLLSSAVPAR